jgi:hypothetical protein
VNEQHGCLWANTVVTSLDGLQLSEYLRLCLLLYIVGHHPENYLLYRKNICFYKKYFY